jgi:hypothetical protein
MRQKPAQKKRKLDAAHHKHALSKEQISDSDDELSDTMIPQARTSTPKPPASRGHARTTSSVSNSGFAASPHIVVNDGDLEIDMGSPPPESRGRQRGRIDPGAFGSAAGTPIFRGNPKAGTTKRLVREEMDDLEIDLGGGGGGVEEGESPDNDVDELELGSPRAGVVRAGQGHQGSRSASSVVPSSHRNQHRYSNSNSSQHQQHDNAPTPTNAAADLDDDDEDLLAKALEAALEDEDGDTGNITGHGNVGYGLGISGAAAGTGNGDDESDVSEEE